MTKLPLAAFTIVIMAISWSSAARETIRFSCATETNSVTHDYIEFVYAQFFDRLGYEFELITTSADHANQLMLSGAVDGDCAHTQPFELSPTAKNYLRVQAPVGSITLGAWSNRPILDYFKTSSNTPRLLKVGYEKGLFVAAEIIHRYSLENTVSLSNTQEGLNAVARGDIDIWIDKVRNMELRIYKKRPPHMVPLYSHLVYPYLHKKHKALLQPFNELTDKKVEETSYESFLSSSYRTELLKNSGKIMHFGCAVKPSSPAFQSVFKIYRNAFKALGYDFYMSYLPTARDASNVKSGLLDGSCARSSTFIEIQADNIVAIKTPIANTQVRVWSLSPDTEITNLDEVARSGASIVIITGLVNLEERLKNYPDINISRVTYPEQGLKLLASRQVDLYIGAKELVLHALKTTQINQPLYDVGLILEETLFPVLNKKHSAIAEALTRELNKQIKPGKTQLLQ